MTRRSPLNVRKRNRPSPGKGKPGRPPHPDPYVSQTKFPKDAPTGAVQDHPVAKVVPMPPPKALAEQLAELPDMADPDEVCATAARWIMSQISLGAPFDRIADALNITAGDITYWALQSPVDTAALATSLEQSAARYDELARQYIEDVGTAAGRDKRAVIAHANSLRCDAEGARALAQGLLRRCTVVTDDQVDRRKKAWGERNAERMRQARRAEKEAARQKRWAQHSVLVELSGFKPAPALTDIQSDHAPITAIEIDCLMPAEYEELKELADEGHIAKAANLLVSIRKRWRAQYDKLQVSGQPSVNSTVTTNIKQRERRKRSTEATAAVPS